ncbi:galectin-4-like [Ostrea edulis]|uniref:galectin-4-like n=1 Tax=Ostrea edulis TaxID=37623 RepID=UPI0024AEE7F6|nr:galectin-4-like [Ostrea edulis]
MYGNVHNAAMPTPATPAGGCPPRMQYPGVGAQPIFNPPVPLTTPIFGGIFPGKMIFINGVPNPNAQRFTINFVCGLYEGSDIALHCDVRFKVDGDYNVVLRNSCQGGSWGAEERQSPYFPFMPNANFDMLIMVEHDKFKIAVNNQHFLEFTHRLQPLNKIDALQVKGDIQLLQVRFQ